MNGNVECEVFSLFSLNIYSVEFEQPYIMRSSPWVEFLFRSSVAS